MWIEGIQNIVNPYKGVNEEFIELQGDISDKDAKIWLYKLFMANPSFAAQQLLGIELYTFQELIIKTCFLSDSTMFLASRGVGKTMLASVIIALFATLNPGTKIGILSASFRQAKETLSKLEELINATNNGMRKAELFIQCVEESNGASPYIRKDGGSWTLKLKIPNNSTITALPLTEKIRGKRFNFIVLDEMLLIDEVIFTDVILPFMSTNQNAAEQTRIFKAENEMIAKGQMKESERTKWPNNKLLILSSASDTYEYLYKLYEQYMNRINGNLDNLNDGNKIDDATYSIIKCSYLGARELAPRLLNESNLTNAMNTMPKARFDKEYGVIFQDEAQGFFLMSQMRDCTYKPGEGCCVQLKGEKGTDYVMSFDTNLNPSEDADDFAIHVFSLNYEEKSATLVHSRAICVSQPKQDIEYMYYLLTNFNIKYMVGDAFGGGFRFVQSCNDSQTFSDNKIKIEVVEDDGFNNLEDIQAIYKQFQAKMQPQNGIVKCLLKTPNNKWASYANDTLQIAINRKLIKFASKAFNDDERNYELNKKIDDWQSLLFRDKAKFKSEEEMKQDWIDYIADVIDKTKYQCSNIVPTITPSGERKFNLPSNMQNDRSANRTRKDSYAALILGNWLIRLLFESINTKKSNMFDDYEPVRF